MGEAGKLKMLHLKLSIPLKGRIKGWSYTNIGTVSLPLFLDSFLNKYPSIDLVINEYQTHEIIDLLENDKLDLGLLVTPLEKHQFFERVLFYEPFLLTYPQQTLF